MAGLLLVPGATGCYSNVPVWNGVPSPGGQVTIELTDQGRVALGTTLGPQPRRVTGRLVAAGDSVFVVNVAAVEYVRAREAAKWNGEQVQVARHHVAGVSERRLSRSRSWLMAGLVVATVAVVSTIAISGFGNDPGSTRPPGDGNGQQQ